MLAQLPDLDGPAGAAFQLRKPAEVTFTIEHNEGTVSTRKDSSCIVVKMRTAGTESKLRDDSWRIVQESLDIRAATHREALSTYRGDHEYVFWTLGSSGYSLVIVDVNHLQWGVTAVGEIKSRGATAPSPAPGPIPHHPALRFYRLSQLSEDLFDAYRNAYLSLECIVNNVSAKEENESETKWLKRVLSGLLANAIPSELVFEGIDALVREIYNNGRLPLFHAKKDFYTPQGPERMEIQSRLIKLHRLLASIMNLRISPLIRGSWGEAGQDLVDSQTAIMLNANEIVYSLGSQQEMREISMEVVDNPRRFGNIWGRVTTSAPTTLSALKSIIFRENGTEITTISLPQQIPLRKVSSVRIELNQLVSNEKAPKPLHPA